MAGIGTGGSITFQAEVQTAYIVDILVKDMRLAEEEAALHDAKVPFVDVTAELFRQCQQRGWGTSDMSIVLKLLADAGTPR